MIEQKSVFSCPNETMRPEVTWKKWVWHVVFALTTGVALGANLRPLQTHLSYPACIVSGNFILEFPSINSRSRLFSRSARSVEQTTSLAAAHAST